MDLIKEAKKLFQAYRKKHNPFPGPNYHYKFMFEYGKLRYEHKQDFNLDLYNISVWLHDIGRYTLLDKTGETDSERDYHKVIGAKIFDDKFAHLIQNSKHKKIIRRCVLEHSGKIKFSNNFKTRHEEIQVIREADKISFLHPVYINWLVKNNNKVLAKKFLKKNYDELKKLNPSQFALDVANDWKMKSQKIIDKAS